MSTYNFVVNDNGKVYCYLWTEAKGHRGPNEIGTCLFEFAKQNAKGARHLVAFCDGCAGQNKNKAIAALMAYIVANTEIESYFLCFLEKGHREYC